MYILVFINKIRQRFT